MIALVGTRDIETGCPSMQFKGDRGCPCSKTHEHMEPTSAIGSTAQDDTKHNRKEPAQECVISANGTFYSKVGMPKGTPDQPGLQRQTPSSAYPGQISHL